MLIILSPIIIYMLYSNINERIEFNRTIANLESTTPKWATKEVNDWLDKIDTEFQYKLDNNNLMLTYFESYAESANIVFRFYNAINYSEYYWEKSLNFDTITVNLIESGKNYKVITKKDSIEIENIGKFKVDRIKYDDCAFLSDHGEVNSSEPSYVCKEREKGFDGEARYKLIFQIPLVELKRYKYLEDIKILNTLKIRTSKTPFDLDRRRSAVSLFNRTTTASLSMTT
ncbi:hypothetical protein [Paenibacillus sp. R14(2021)]|uniref:hypothetical protein n=1 Tax=Paenibacillus sp. R14(2021) TaxID=2859228 RepID=UPI001C61276F|nr:hypothetical protein [Paenibacillus sp. R14(2021)]